MAETLTVEALKDSITSPQRLYLWEFDIPSPAAGSADVWYLRALSATIPGESFEAIEINYKGTEGFVVPGRKRVTHEFTVAVLESEDAETFNNIHDWFELIRNSRTGVGAPDPTVKSDIMVSLKKLDKTDAKKIKIKGAWVKSMDEQPLGSDASEVQIYNVTFAFDTWEKVS